MASVFKRSPKASNWTFSYRDANGKQITRKGGTDKGVTQRMAAKLEDEQRQIKLGVIDAASIEKRRQRSKPVNDHVADFESSMKAARRTQGHVAYTTSDVRKLIAFADVKTAAEITRAMVDRWSLDLQKTDANRTTNRRIDSVKAFLRWGHANGAVNEFVLHKYPKLPVGGRHSRRKSRPLCADEATKLVAIVDDTDRADLYAFALKTGLRSNECRQVAFAMFDLPREQMTLPPEVTKARRAQSVPLHRDVLAIVSRRMIGRDPADLVFPNVPTKANINERLKQHCKRAGVDPKDVTFHSLRHSFCTMLARANVHPALLQKLARHADLKTTLGYYVHLQRDDEATAIAKLAF